MNNNLFKEENAAAGGFTVHEEGEWEQEEEEYEESQNMFNSGFRSVLKDNENMSIEQSKERLRGGGGPGGADFRTASNVGMVDQSLN